MQKCVKSLAIWVCVVLPRQLSQGGPLKSSDRWHVDMLGTSVATKCCRVAAIRDSTIFVKHQNTSVCACSKQLRFTREYRLTSQISAIGFACQAGTLVSNMSLQLHVFVMPCVMVVSEQRFSAS